MVWHVFSDFKLYLKDIGLLRALSELDKTSILNNNAIFVEFKGAFTEQYVLQELIACKNIKPYYSGEKIHLLSRLFTSQRGECNSFGS